MSGYGMYSDVKQKLGEALCGNGKSLNQEAKKFGSSLRTRQLVRTMPKYQSKPQLSGLLQRRKQNLQSLCEDWGTLTSLDFKQRLDREGLEATEQEVGAVDLIFNVGGSVVFPKGLAPKAVHKAPEVVSVQDGPKVPVASESVSEVAKKVIDDHVELLEKLADGDSHESKRAKKKKSSDDSNS